MNVFSTTITGGASADADPVANPGSIPPDRLIGIGERIPQTDQQPASAWLGLTGTAGQSCVVSIYTTFDDPQVVMEANRKWQLVASGITVTVNQTTRAPLVPGLCCVRVTTVPAASAKLYLKPSAQPYATPTS